MTIFTIIVIFIWTVFVPRFILVCVIHAIYPFGIALLILLWLLSLIMDLATLDNTLKS